MPSRQARTQPVFASSRSRPAIGRRVLLGVVVLVAATSAAVWWTGTGSSRARPGATVFVVDGRPVRSLEIRAFLRPDGSLDRGRLVAATRATLPRAVLRRSRNADLLSRLDVDAAIGAVRTIGPRGGRVHIPSRPLAATVRAPVIAQRLRNDCEATALQILLATTGLKDDQLRLQAKLPRSGPLDPRGADGAWVWGDPDQGFVGRPDGGGRAGGFGVYPGPVARLARKLGRPLRTVREAPAVYEHLLAGRAVMTWVGLENGPYSTWTTPAGRRITVNLNEHTVVLVGLRRDGMLQVVNPLTGTRELWSKRTFETMWNRLGRRALSA